MFKVFYIKNKFRILIYILLILHFLLIYIFQTKVAKNQFIFNNLILKSIGYVINLSYPIIGNKIDYNKYLQIENILKLSYPIFCTSKNVEITQKDIYEPTGEDVIIFYDYQIEEKLKNSVANSVYAKTYSEEKINQEQEPIILEKLNFLPTDLNKISLMNRTNYKINVLSTYNKYSDVANFENKPSILIYHTHTTESYKPSSANEYKILDSSVRTLNLQYSVARVGKELANILSKKYGYKVYHSTEINDYPEYKGSYTRSLKVIEDYKKKYPDIKVFLDIHRDAYNSKGSNLKFVSKINGINFAKIMLVVGTNQLGLYHPDWEKNLSFALRLQRNIMSISPTIVRPIDLSPARYNQHISPTSIIIEIGSNGNTLNEALASCHILAKALDQTLKGR